MTIRACSSLAVTIALVLAAAPLLAEQGDTRKLLDASLTGVEKRIAPSWGSAEQVSVARSQVPTAPGFVVIVRPGKAQYPGVDVRPERGAAWDLSAFGHVEARLRNTGSHPITISLEPWNDLDWRLGPFNCESITLAPGAAGTLPVIFGYSYGGKPGYPLKTRAVARVMIFTGTAEYDQSFRIESLVAGGRSGEKPPVDPDSVRVSPRGGVILGSRAAFEPEKQLEVAGGVEAHAAGTGLRVTFPARQGEQALTVKPAVGRWYLGASNRIRVRLKNAGLVPVTPRVQAFSDGYGFTDRVAGAVLNPGRAQEIIVPFSPAVCWDGRPGTGTSFRSDAVGGITITADHQGAATILVDSIAADTTVASLPDWVGRRPPAEGEWVKTFDDEFDRPVIDGAKWNVAGPNFWDKTTHWSRHNVILGGGVVRLRYERKRGFHNDDPGQTLDLTVPKVSETEYACGLLETYGKWVQRYGYFEARLKLPTAPGLWATFWLMPDRGGASPQWVRQDTANGAMEVDIMEHLTRWGPRRYNIALHWDGYGDQHKSAGSACIYAPSVDAGGFITCGLLWLPGKLVYYCQGQEVARWENARVSNVQADMMLTMPMGGWDNNAVDDRQLPADFVIDYVRVWQRRDLASPVDGYQGATKVGTGPAAR